MTHCRPGCETIFHQCDGYTTHFYVFLNADSESDMEKLEFETNDHADNLKYLILQWGTQNSKLGTFNTKGSYSLKMSRGFQIWPQNSHRTIFGPLFGHKTVDNWILPVFDSFLPKLGSNVVRCKIWNRFETERCKI